MKTTLFFSAATVLVLSLGASAQVTCDVTVVEGSTGDGLIEISIDSLFGTETQSDTAWDIAVSGVMNMDLEPNAEPFTEVTVSSMLLALADGQVEYDFFCLPIFGCQHVVLNFSNFEISLLEPVSATIASDGSVVLADIAVLMSFNYDVSGDVFQVSGTSNSDPKDPPIVTFSFRLNPNDGDMLVDSVVMSPVPGEIPADTLPTGVYSVTTLTTVDLSKTTMFGTYEPGSVLGDLNGDGIVNGADLGLLLAQWGSTGTADLNGDGVVNGADLGLMLAAWG